MSSAAGPSRRPNTPQICHGVKLRVGVYSTNDVCGWCHAALSCTGAGQQKVPVVPVRPSFQSYSFGIDRDSAATAGPAGVVVFDVRFERRAVVPPPSVLTMPDHAETNGDVSTSIAWLPVSFVVGLAAAVGGPMANFPGTGDGSEGVFSCVLGGGQFGSGDCGLPPSYTGREVTVGPL